MLPIFKSTKNVIVKLDDFFDAVDESGLLFLEGVKNYMKGRDNNFDQNIKTIAKVESKADDLRRSIESDLYRHTLMPEYRGDVLRLLDKMDDLIDRAKENLVRFDVEKPDFPQELHEGFIELTEASTSSVSYLVTAARAFFREVKMVRDQLHRVYYYEKEADSFADELKRKLFSDQMGIDLSRRQHLRYFIEHTEKLSDRAEEVADMVSIYAIKRIV
mgnify:CR=1 FL=1